MKKLFLLFFVSLFFLGCNSDYEESKWIIVNNFDKDIHLTINGVGYTAKAKSLSPQVEYIAGYSENLQINFEDGSHLTTSDGWYYKDGNTFHAVNIIKQELYTFNVFYDGPYNLFATSNLIRTSEGKLKKLIYDPHGTAYKSDTYELSDKYVYPSQPCYEKEVPSYIFYRFSDDITEEQKKEFEDSDYIDYAKMPYLVQMIPYTRFFESYKLYIEYPKEFVTDEKVSGSSNSAD